MRFYFFDLFNRYMQKRTRWVFLIVSILLSLIFYPFAPRLIQMEIGGYMQWTLNKSIALFFSPLVMLLCVPFNKSFSANVCFKIFFVFHIALLVGNLLLLIF